MLSIARSSKKIRLHSLWVGIWLICFSAGCGSQSSAPQPTPTLSPLNAFDAYMVGTWKMTAILTTFKSPRQLYTLRATDGYDYTYVFKSDHTYNFTAVVTGGPAGTGGTTTASGKWATSITAGSKPDNSFAFPNQKALSAEYTIPTDPFSIVFTVTQTSDPMSFQVGGQQIVYIVGIDYTDNKIQWDYTASTGASEYYASWYKTK